MAKKARRTSRFTRTALRYASFASLAVCLVAVLWVLLYRWVFPPTTITQMGIPQRDAVRYTPVPLERISPALALSVLASEDQRFLLHKGFDGRAIRRAAADIIAGTRFRGASTISQQTAKNAFLWQGRSWVRKGLEAGFTAAIETLWTKRRILEVYLNIAQMGPALFGAQAAATAYFGRDAARLSLAQSAALASILPSPATRSPLRPTGRQRRKIAWIRSQVRYLAALPSTRAFCRSVWGPSWRAALR